MKRMIRKAVLEDVPVIMRLVDEARGIMRSSGNMNQWTDGYPSRETIEDDIHNGHCFLCVEEGGVIVASFAFIPGPEPTYKEIYEGDIMYSEFSDGSGGYSLIGWNEREASFGMMDAYSYQSKQEGYDFPEFKNYVLIAHLQKALICEVVGNIYDNPELLTKTK